VTGTVKKLVPDRGFGFIRSTDGKEFFFHGSSVEAPATFDELTEGTEVDFEEEPSRKVNKGPRAYRVQVVGA
jgi:CspA family cold shock protein